MIIFDDFPSLTDNETLKSQTKEKNEYLLKATVNPLTVRGKTTCDCAP